MPEDLIPDVVKSFYLDGALLVVPKRMEDGAWQVAAEFEGKEIPALAARRTATS